MKAKGRKQRRLPLDVMTLAELHDYVAKIPSRTTRPFPIAQQWAWELAKPYGAVITSTYTRIVSGILCYQHGPARGQFPAAAAGAGTGVDELDCCVPAVQ
ncbi:MAG: hypothetical protein WCE82_03455 [Halobacteriota archaeon]